MKTRTTDQLVPLMATGLLGDLIASNNSASESIFTRYFNSMAPLVLILDQSKLKCDIKRIDGTNFGCPYLGVYDYPFRMLANIILRA